MIKRVGVLLLLSTSLGAFEDVSFSARTLGLGGDQAAVADDAFASITNPALPARWRRPVVGISAMTLEGSHFYGTFSCVQPVPGLGSIGGSFFYRNYDSHLGDWLKEADARFFFALPIGRYFNVGASLGNHSQEYFSESGGFPLPSMGFSSGPVFSVGTAVVLPSNLTFGVSACELFKSDVPAIFHTAVGWRPKIKNPSFFSSPLVALNLTFSGSTVKVHTGGELNLFKDILGVRAGIRYGSDSASGFAPTFGATLRTHRIEKIDFELNYGAVLGYFVDSPSLSHQLDLVVRIGDARKAEKDSILAEQADRARRLREQALARERDKLRAELEAIKEERSALEQERKDIERLRHEALAALGRLKGIEFTENDTFTRITIRETALRFGADSAEIPFPRGYRTLDKVTAFLSHYPNNRIVVEVYAGIGSRESSEETSEGEPRYKDAKALAEARARMIRRYLVEVKGLASSQVTARGEERPLEEEEPEAESPARQRVEITIVK